MISNPGVQHTPLFQVKRIPLWKFQDKMWHFAVAKCCKAAWFPAFCSRFPESSRIDHSSSRPAMSTSAILILTTFCLAEGRLGRKWREELEYMQSSKGLLSEPLVVVTRYFNLFYIAYCHS
jgi:hypothetical protein